jgi:hypothetical protein
VTGHDDWAESRRKALLEVRANLTEYAQVITEFRQLASDPSRPPEEQASLLDEAAQMAAELDQDLAEWMDLHGKYMGVKTDIAQLAPQAPTLDGQFAALEDRFRDMLARIDALEACGHGSPELTAQREDILRQQQDARKMRASWAPVPKLASSLVSRVRARTAPRARTSRPRAVRAAVSLGGDSGDDPGEPDGPPVARLGRAIRHALARIARRAGL